MSLLLVNCSRHWVLLLLLLLATWTVAFQEKKLKLSPGYLNDIQADQAYERAAGEFDYEYQGDDWTGLCADGRNQSPIDLIYNDTIHRSIPRLRFFYYNQSLRTPIVITNNGHSANLVVPLTRGGQRPYINGGLLRGNYQAQSVHFHWGSANSKGSEHAINYERYDVEMHIVHKHERYANVSDASMHSDGLAVLGVMLNAVPWQSTQQYGLNKIFNQLPRIVNYNSNATITGQLNLGQLLGNIITGEFYSYNGSLTTPECNEAVTWTVFPDVINVPERQVKKFFSLKDSNNMTLINNYRSIQDLNERPVYYRSMES